MRLQAEVWESVLWTVVTHWELGRCPSVEVIPLILERTQGGQDYTGLVDVLCVYVETCVGTWGRDCYSQCVEKPLISYLRKNDMIRFALRWHSPHHDFSVACFDWSPALPLQHLYPLAFRTAVSLDSCLLCYVFLVSLAEYLLISWLQSIGVPKAYPWINFSSACTLKVILFRIIAHIWSICW